MPTDGKTFEKQLEDARTALQLALYFLRTILEDRKKGLYLVFLEEDLWKAAEKSPMASFLKKYQGSANAPGPPPGRETWSDLVVKRLGDELVLLWRTREPDEVSYALVKKGIRIVRGLLRTLRNPDGSDPRVRKLVARLSDRRSARETLREVVTRG